MESKNLIDAFWVEAISTLVYLKNRSPTKILNHKTPFEALYRYKSIVSHLRIFGSKSFSHVPNEDRRKLDAKAIKCIFVGYYFDHKAYKMFDPSTHKVFASIDVLFHEHARGRIVMMHGIFIINVMMSQKKLVTNMSKNKRNNLVICTSQSMKAHVEEETSHRKAG